MARAKFFQWTSPSNGKVYWVAWYDHAPDNKVHFCQARTCKRKVLRDEPRLCMNLMDDGGKVLKKSHGNSQLWVCEDCARDVPNHPKDNIQQDLW